MIIQKYTYLIIFDVVLEPINRLKINVEYYSISDDFTIKDEIVLNGTEAILYVNYFGLMDAYIIALSKKYSNLIIDNAQAFFSKPVDSVITYYSPRKYFGVSDGGYLSTDTYLTYKLYQDNSNSRLNHLLIRACDSAENGYDDFKKNERLLCNQSLKVMSKITKRILQSINYKKAKISRETNFNYLHKHFKHLNKLDIPSAQIPGPMTYPLYIEEDGIRESLIEKKIFVQTYWPNVFDFCKKDQFEYQFAKYLIPLPIDQRYNKNDMDFILSTLSKFISIKK